MKTHRHRRQRELGVALVIAIFTLMLISVVATALVLMAGTETALKGNYKSAMHAFYDAKAGLEEGRGRLFARNPNPISNCVLPGGEAMMQLNQVCYIVNPSAGEVVNPLDLSAGNPYADVEYQQEWQMPVTSATVQPLINSISPIAIASIAGPLFKWVRITPRTEFSGNIDVDGINGKDSLNPLFYDGMQQLLSSGGKPVPGASQVLTITALAVTPYGSRRMVQYTVALAGSAAALANIPSALTLDGNGVSFTGPGAGNGNGNGSFQIIGNDLNAPSGTQSGVPAIGYTNSGDGPSLSTSAMPSGNYLSPAGTPNVSYLPPWAPQTPSGLPLILQTPSGLDNLVTSITQNADLVLNPPKGTPADQTSLPTGMSASNPMVVVVDGDFNLHGNGTGYGLLVVTGTLDYDPDASWNGVILVIGQGTFTSSKAGNGVIDGAVFVAQTRDAAGNLLANLGYSSYTQTGGGRGIQYSSNWVKAAQALLPYQVLSFREIPQTTP